MRQFYSVPLAAYKFGFALVPLHVTVTFVAGQKFCLAVDFIERKKWRNFRREQKKMKLIESTGVMAIDVTNANEVGDLDVDRFTIHHNLAL